VDIRRAFPGEGPSLAALWLRSRAASAPSIPPTIHTDQEVHQWFKEVILSAGEVWVADAPDGLMALMVLDDGWIDQLYVDPASTRRGIGGSLLDHAKTLQSNGLKLWTLSEQPPRPAVLRRTWVRGRCHDYGRQRGAVARRLLRVAACLVGHTQLRQSSPGCVCPQALNGTARRQARGDRLVVIVG